MKKKPIFGRTIRWTWAISAAIMFHIALYWGVSLTSDSEQKLRRQYRQLTQIQYFDAQTAERSEVLAQQMTLFDPRPLLLPTSWNVSNASSITDFLQEEEQIFSDFDPMFELEDGNYLDDFGNAAANYDELSAAQADFDFTLFKQLGRTTKASDFEQEKGILVSMISPDSGRAVSSASIYNEEVDLMAREWPEWRPATLLASVEDSFAVGGFSVLESSGFDEVDQRLRGIAHAVFPRLGQLEDGVYLLEFTP